MSCGLVRSGESEKFYDKFSVPVQDQYVVQS
jgi:hypothetical protein